MTKGAKKKLLLIGGGGHCRSCIDVIRATQLYAIVGILDVAEKVGSQINGASIIGTDTELTTFLADVDECLITIGQLADGELRKLLFESVLAANGKLATIVSPTAIVSESAHIGDGTIVMHQAVVNAGARIGQNNIVNTLALVEHDAVIGDHSHISTRASINGGAKVGSQCFVGSHAVIFHQCNIGDHCSIGGGQVVRNDLPAQTKASAIANAGSAKDQATFVIAEAGVNHNGDLALALKMIEVAANAGANAVKFQTFHAEELSTAYAKKADYQKKATAHSESQQTMLKALELPKASWQKLVDHCQLHNIEFMSTAFDAASLAFLLELGIKRIKIPSGELTNVPLLRYCAQQGLPIILSTGMASLSEIAQAKSVLLAAGAMTEQLSILHCNTAYPTPFDDASLNCVHTLKQLGCHTGYSDHTLGDEAIIASIALGAVIVEKHFTLDRNMDGPDQTTSLEPNELSAMIEKIRNIEKAFGNGNKAPTPSEIDNIVVARKSIVASQAIQKGEILTENNLTTKRPGDGLSAFLWDQVIGQKALRDYAVDEQIEL